MTKTPVSTNMARERVTLRALLIRRARQDLLLEARDPATTPLSGICGSKLAVKTLASIVATFLLLIATRSTVFSVTFTDVTGSAGLHETGFNFGVPIWGDFNNDGNLDLLVDNYFRTPPYVYRNNGDGTFTDIFPTAGINGGGDRQGSAWVDFDNDGDLDLSYIKGASGAHNLGRKKDELYRNRGDEQFRDIAEQAGVTNTFGRGRGVACGDYNNDGFLDLLVANFRTDLVLYKSAGDGTFVDITASAGLTGLQYTECVFADYNNDGFPDIFCTVTYPHPSFLEDVLLKNNGNGTFTDVSNQAGILPLIHGRALAWGDYDNDGDLDLFISRGTKEGTIKPTFYRNNGDGTFAEATDKAGLGAVTNSRAATWGDFNNDGYLDLYVVNSGSDPVGKGANQLYRNNQDGTFTDVATRAGVAVLVASRGRGAAWGDYDNDGFLDLFVTNGENKTQFEEGPQMLYHNEGNGNNWLKINLRGTVSNRQGLGAKVTIQIGQAIQYREANGAGGHFFSQGAGPLHFGLGNATVVDQIRVKWPSGLNQILNNVSVNREIRVVEGQ